MSVYTSEVYPTAVRAISMGVLNSFSRVGALSSPYVAQVLFQKNDYATIFVYGGFSLVLVVVSLVLPLETKGTRLKDEI